MNLSLDQETPWNLFRPFAQSSVLCRCMEDASVEEPKAQFIPGKVQQSISISNDFQHIFTRYVASFSCRPLWVPEMAFVGFIVLSKLGGSSKPELRSMALWMRSGVRWFWHFSGLQFQLSDEYRWTTFFALFCPDFKERSKMLAGYP